MELLNGIDLEQLIEQRGALDEATIVDIMVPVLAGLTAVHDAGVVHRDLKPGNVFLAQGRYDEVDPKLLDFGICKAPGPEQLRLTANGMLIGTPFYMSPEGLRGEEMTPKSDQYSLGVVMYECATGTNPFGATNFAEIFRLIGAGQYASPSAVRPQISKRLERIIVRAMSLDPAQRFKDLREMGRELLLLAGQRTRITWSLSFGELERPRGLSGEAWQVPQGSPSLLEVHDEPPPRKRSRALIAVPLLLLVAVLGFGWSRVVTEPQAEATPHSALPPAAAVGAPVAAVGAPVEAVRAPVEGTGPSVEAVRAPAEAVAAPVEAVAAPVEPPAELSEPAPQRTPEVTPKPAEVVATKPALHHPGRKALPARQTATGVAPERADESADPDWAIPANPAASPAKAPQGRTPIGVGANGAPIFD